MSNGATQMTGFFSNPAYLMPALILAAVVLYYLYGAIDKVGLETQIVDATVTAKDHTEGSTTYVNRIAGGRSWVQAQKQSDFFAVSLTINAEPTAGLVTRDKFDQLKVGDHVRATIRYTRISGKLQVIAIN